MGFGVCETTGNEAAMHSEFGVGRMLDLVSNHEILLWSGGLSVIKLITSMIDVRRESFVNGSVSIHFVQGGLRMFRGPQTTELSTTYEK